MLKLWEESKTFWPVVEENMGIKKELEGKRKGHLYDTGAAWYLSWTVTQRSENTHSFSPHLYPLIDAHTHTHAHELRKVRGNTPRSHSECEPKATPGISSWLCAVLLCACRWQYSTTELCKLSIKNFIYWCLVCMLFMCNIWAYLYAPYLSMLLLAKSHSFLGCETFPLILPSQTNILNPCVDTILKWTDFKNGGIKCQT